ncbi:MAG TPA: YciI family protein [Acidimicrobiales bacterium]
MKGFVFRLIPPRPDFASDLSDDERAIISEHAGYWSGLAAQGTALAFGPVADPAGGYGIGIIVVDDLQAAEALRDADPAVTSPHGFRSEISPMLRLVTPTGQFDAT